MIKLSDKSNWTNISDITKKSISKGGKFLRIGKVEFYTSEGKNYVNLEGKRFIKLDYNPNTGNYLVTFFMRDILRGDHMSYKMESFTKLEDMRSFLKGIKSL